MYKRQDVIAAAYRKSKDQVGLPKEQMINYVKNIYAPFTDEEITAKMMVLLTPKGCILYTSRCVEETAPQSCTQLQSADCFRIPCVLFSVFAEGIQTVVF